MGLLHPWVLTCDEFGCEALQPKFSTDRDALEWAADSGWLVLTPRNNFGMRRVFCPDHRKAVES